MLNKFIENRIDKKIKENPERYLSTRPIRKEKRTHGDAII